MLEKLQAVASRYEELCAKAEQPDFYADPARAAKLLKERNELEPIAEAYTALRQAQQEQEEARELLAGETDPDMKELCQEQFQSAKETEAKLLEKLKILLLPKDPNDEKNVIVEIRGGVGGEESALFAHSLFRMYSMYAAARGWTVELLNYNDTELGGVKEADFLINGAGRLVPAEIRKRRPPGPAGAGDRIRRPGPHLHRHGGCAAGDGRGGRGNSTRRTLKCRSTGPPAQAASM